MPDLTDYLRCKTDLYISVIDTGSKVGLEVGEREKIAERIWGKIIGSLAKEMKQHDDNYKNEYHPASSAKQAR